MSPRQREIAEKFYKLAVFTVQPQSCVEKTEPTTCDDLNNDSTFTFREDV